jgi:hypothetical protein
MSKPKTPPLSDWTVAFTGAVPPFTLTIRATSLDRDGADYVLRDVFGHELLAVPRGQVVYVKRIERGGEVPAGPASSSSTFGPGPFAPIEPIAPDLITQPEPGSPAAEKPVPAPRRSAKRGGK